MSGLHLRGNLGRYAPLPRRTRLPACCSSDIPDYNEKLCLSPELSAQWDKVIALRTDVNKALEAARGQKLVGKSLDAEVTLYLTAEGKKAFDAMGQHDLAAVCIVSRGYRGGRRRPGRCRRELPRRNHCRGTRSRHPSAAAAGRTTIRWTLRPSCAPDAQACSRRSRSAKQNKVKTGREQISARFCILGAFEYETT